MRVAVCGVAVVLLTSVSEVALSASLPLVDCLQGSCSPAFVQKAEATTDTSAPAAKTTTAKVSDLLHATKQAAAVSIVHIKNTMADGKGSKSSVLLFNAFDAFRGKIAALEAAIASKNGVAISTANREAQSAYATLVSTYVLVGGDDKTLAETLRAITSSWAAYASHFVLTKPASVGENAMKIDAVTATVDKVYDALTQFEAPAAKDTRLARQVAYMKRRIDRHKKNGVSPATYRYAMSDLALVRGSDQALLAVTEAYYPDAFAALKQNQTAFSDHEAYWSAYYDGLFDTAMIQRLSGDIAVPDDTALKADVSQSEISAAANDDAVAKDLHDIQSAATDKSDTPLPPDASQAALDEPLPSETAFDCVAEGCGDTQAVNPAADTSEIDAPASPNGTDQPAPADTAPAPAATDTPAPPADSSPPAATDNTPPPSPPASPAPPSAPASAEPPPSADSPTPADQGAAAPPAAAAPSPADAAPADNPPPSDAQPSPGDNAPANNGAEEPPADAAPSDNAAPPADTPPNGPNPNNAD